MVDRIWKLSDGTTISWHGSDDEIEPPHIILSMVADALELIMTHMLLEESPTD